MVEVLLFAAGLTAVVASVTTARTFIKLRAELVTAWKDADYFAAFAATAGTHCEKMRIERDEAKAALLTACQADMAGDPLALLRAAAASEGYELVKREAVPS